MSLTPRLTLPLLAAGQAQKHVTHNEALLRLDALAQLSVLTRTLTAPPPTPLDGATYIIAAPATGDFANKEKQIAFYRQNAFEFIVPQQGFTAFVQDEAVPYVFNGTDWVLLTTPAAPHTHTITNITGLQTALNNKAPATHTHAELQNMTLLGIGATADANNPLLAKLNTALFMAKPVSEGGTGDLRYTFNKEATSNALSIVFQSNWSGRAEMGLVGQDNYSFRVSPDGSAWQDAIQIDKTTAQVEFPKGVGKSQLDIFTSNGTWTKPAWAKRVIAYLVGGGGGGGGGRLGAASTNRYGGGGGGAGGYTYEEFLSAELPATLTIQVGNGGGRGAEATTNDTNGGAGQDGQTTLLKDGTNNILAATGGNGGVGGSLTATAGGTGGIGSHFKANSGGAGGATAAIYGSYDIGLSGGGGGGGGGLNAANITSAGAVGGFGYSCGSTAKRANRGLGGAAGLGGWNGDDKTWDRGFGGGAGGAGGGDAAATSSGGWGGNGGNPGGGGGGGGGATNNTASGAGGLGGRGEVWLLCLG